MAFAATQIRPLLVIIGPSGCGKSTLVRRLAESGALRVHPTWTTRPPREDEDPTDERLEHRFVDEARFEELKSHGFFLGTTQMFGLPHHYGLPRLELQPAGPVDAVMLRAPLVEQLRALVPQLVVYHVDADLEQATARIVGRSVDAAEAQARVAANGAELDQGHEIADRVFTNGGDIDELVDSVLAALWMDFGPSLSPAFSMPLVPAQGVEMLQPPSAELPQVPRKRSVGEKVALGVLTVIAALTAGVFVLMLLFAYGMSQWSNNK